MQATYLKDILKRKTTLNDYESAYEEESFWKNAHVETGKSVMNFSGLSHDIV